MEPTKLEAENWYRIKEGFHGLILEGTNRIVYCYGLARDSDTLGFFFSKGGANIRFSLDEVECWVPAVGEEALFWDDVEADAAPLYYSGYDCGADCPLRTTNGSYYKHCKPIEEEPKRKPLAPSNTSDNADRIGQLEGRMQALEEKIDYLVNQIQIDLAKGKIIQEKDLQDATPMIIGEFVRTACGMAGIKTEDSRDTGIGPVRRGD